MLTAVLISLILIQLGLFGWVAWKLSDLMAYARETRTEVTGIRLNTSTRQSRASIQSGVEAPEKELVRLGRASRGRRVVVGGDPDSQLSQELTHSLGPQKDTDDE